MPKQQKESEEKPVFYGTHRVLESSNSIEKGAGRMEDRLARPMFAHDAPPLWRCNAQKEHCPEGIECRELTDKAPVMHPCRCRSCMLEEYPYLQEGPPHVTREEFRSKIEKDCVGLYEPAGFMKLEAACAVCREYITLTGSEAEKFWKEREEIIHVTCMSSEDAQALHSLCGGSYALPYLIRGRKQECLEEGKNNGGG